MLELKGNADDQVPSAENDSSGVQKLKYRGMVMEEKLFQPSLAVSDEREPDSIFVETEPVTLHTAELISYSRKVKALIDEQKSNFAKNKKPVASLPDLPPLPELRECALKNGRSGDLISLKNQRQLSSEDDSSDSSDSRETPTEFVLGHGSIPPRVSGEVAFKILKRSVMALCAHAGYDNVTESAVTYLTNAAHDYLTQICDLLGKNVDRCAVFKRTGFIDPLEQTFFDMGLGSVVLLKNFYKSRFIDYHDRVLKECLRLIEEYKSLPAKFAQKCKQDALKEMSSTDTGDTNTAAPTDEENTPIGDILLCLDEVVCNSNGSSEKSTKSDLQTSRGKKRKK